MNTVSICRSSLFRCRAVALVSVVLASTFIAAPQRRTAKKAKVRTVVKTLAPAPIAAPEPTPSQIPTASPTRLTGSSANDSPSQIPTVTAPGEMNTVVLEKPLVPEEAAAPPVPASPPEVDKLPAIRTESLSTEQQQFERTIINAPLRADEKWQAQWQNAPQPRIEAAWYTACYKDNDVLLCENFSLLLVRNCYNSAYYTHASKLVIRYGTERKGQEFQQALNDFYNGGQTLQKFDQLVATGQPLIHQPYVLAQIMLAGTSVSLSSASGHRERIKHYVDKAMTIFPAKAGNSSPTSQSDGDRLRLSVQAEGNKFLAWYFHPYGKNDETLTYLARAIAIKGLDRQGWKDPFNYWLRSLINQESMSALQMRYDALPPEQKNGPVASALLAQVQGYRQVIAEDLARIVALGRSDHDSSANVQLRQLLQAEPNQDQIIQNLIKRFESEFAAT